jgi:hypothetical protein
VASKMASPKTSKKGRQHVVFFFLWMNGMNDKRDEALK